MLPRERKTGVVTCFFKKGDERVGSDYRGITLLTLPEKVYSMVLPRRVWLLMELQIQEEPHGFPTGHVELDQPYCLEGVWNQSTCVCGCGTGL